jgi:hypothetical protein
LKNNLNATLSEECIGEKRYAHKILVRKPEGKSSLIIKQIFKETPCKDVGQIHLVRIGSSGSCKYGTEPSCSIKASKFLN